MSKSDVHCVPTRNVFSSRCVGLYLSLFHLKLKCGRRGDGGTRMSAIRTKALLCAMLLIIGPMVPWSIDGPSNQSA